MEFIWASLGLVFEGHWARHYILTWQHCAQLSTDTDLLLRRDGGVLLRERPVPEALLLPAVQTPAEDGRRAGGGRPVRVPTDDAHGHVLHEVVDDRRDVRARSGLAEHVQHLDVLEISLILIKLFIHTCILINLLL